MLGSTTCGARLAVGCSRPARAFPSLARRLGIAASKRPRFTPDSTWTRFAKRSRQQPGPCSPPVAFFRPKHRRECAMPLKYIPGEFTGIYQQYRWSADDPVSMRKAFEAITDSMDIDVQLD